MADKQITDLGELGANTASADELVIYDLSTTLDKKISFNDLSNEVLAEFGFTGSAAELNILDGANITTAELNILDDVTADKAELNILDGATLSTAELNYVDGVTSAIQTQFSGVQTQLIEKLDRDQQEGGNGSSTTAKTPTISAESQVIALQGSSNSVDATLSGISNAYAQTIIVKCTDATNNCTVVANVNDSGFLESDGTTGTTIEFDATDEFVILKSSTISGGYWVIVGGIYTLT